MALQSYGPAVDAPAATGSPDLKGALARRTAAILVTVFAASVFLSLLMFPLFRIYGDSMSPTLDEGDVVATLRPGSLSSGDLVVFSFNNKILLKRVVAGPGDWVDIQADGTVLVNGAELSEPYLTPQQKSLGQVDIALPYQVPDGSYFVLGDHRDVSIDSRLAQVGCIPKDQIVGKVALRVWPINELGPIG